MEMEMVRGSCNSYDNALGQMSWHFKAFALSHLLRFNASGEGPYRPLSSNYLPQMINLPTFMHTN